LFSRKNVNVIIFVAKIENKKSKNSKNNTNHLKFVQEVQVAMKISVKISQSVTLFLTPKTITTKTLKSNLLIKPKLFFYLIDL